MSHFIGLVRNVEKKPPSLQNISILIQGRDRPEAEDSFLFQAIVEECSNVRLKLRIEEEPFGTKLPYFKAQTQDWWLGRDHWYPWTPMN
jgi:hypothetical protein